MLRVRVTLSGFEGGPGLSTFYFTSGAYDAATAARVRARVQSLFASGLRTVMWNGSAWTIQPEVDEINPATGAINATLSGSTSYTGNGTAGVDAAPLAAQALVSWTTNDFTAGKRLRGRSFIGPLASAAVNPAGSLIEGIRSGMGTHLATYLVPSAEGDVPVIWHRPVAGLGGNAGQIVSGVMRSKIAVLTSRRD